MSNDQKSKSNKVYVMNRQRLHLPSVRNDSTSSILGNVGYHIEFSNDMVDKLIDQSLHESYTEPKIETTGSRFVRLATSLLALKDIFSVLYDRLTMPPPRPKPQTFRLSRRDHDEFWDAISAEHSFVRRK